MTSVDVSLRERLYARVAERVSTLAETEAADWIVEHRLLSMARWQELSGGVRERLRAQALKTAAYNLYLVSRFQAVVDALEGVPVCPLKGIHLLGTVYREDPESRVLTDLDLLVPREGMEEAVARLRALGLEETPVSRRIRDVSPERVLVNALVTVELHSRLAFKHAGRSTWEDVAPGPGRLYEREVFLLDRETTLVHLVVHFVKHRPFSRLGWVEDILRWVEAGVDPERATGRARDLGGLRSFIAGVHMLRRAVGPIGLAPVADRPPGVAGRLAVGLNEWLVWRELLSDPWRAGPGGPAGRTLSALLLSDRTRDARRFLQAKFAEFLRR